MATRWLFLRWALIASLTIVATIIAFFLGLFRATWELDSSKISFLILAFFLFGTIRSGLLTWQTNSLLEKSRSQLSDQQLRQALSGLAQQNDNGWFVRTLCQELGYLGTIIGLVMAFASLGNLHNTEQASVMRFLREFTYSMFTAAITTVVGLICSILLSFQCQNLSNAIDQKLNGGPDD